jgi:hypothetical protein
MKLTLYYAPNTRATVPYTTPFSRPPSNPGENDLFWGLAFTLWNGVTPTYPDASHRVNQ